LNDALEWTYADGLAELRAEPLPALLQTAKAFGLAQGAIINVTNAAELAAARAHAVVELETQRDQQRLELLLLAGEFKLRLNNAKWVIEHILPMAEMLMRTPEARCRVFSAYADAWESKGKLPQAIAAARQAVDAASGAPSAELRAQAGSRLQGLQATAAEDAVVVRDDAMDLDDFVARRCSAASSALTANQPARALAILDPLPAMARSDTTRGHALLARGAALMELDRVAEAKSDFAAASDLFEPAVNADPAGESDLLPLRETALLLAATAHARLGEARPAWDSAERARSIRLRRALGIAPAGEADWPALREVLTRRRAAVMSVETMHWGTLVLSAGPGEAEPQAALYRDFRPPDMNRLLVGEPLRDDSDVWNSIMTDAIPQLSALLMPALRERLLALAGGIDILYLMPDAALWTAPWAALEVAPGRTLAELIPFALLPFSALLTASSAAPAPRRNCLALATGRDLEGYDFVGHLELLKPLLATLSPRWLAGDDATTAALRDAGRPDILYLSSHGAIDGETADVDRASRLRLADVEPLPSGDVAGWTLGAGPVLKQLTFLNACQAGRFRSLTRTEMGGFPAAFLRSGRSTLIAPLTHVDPHAAGALAVAFFKAYLTGVPVGAPTAARALQTARLELRASGAPPSDWAAHTLFGVDC
jgi:tetratricopeptide (TPR) repeat protein